MLWTRLREQTMKFASAYELKKSLKRQGYDLEGVQVRQAVNTPGVDFLIVPMSARVSNEVHDLLWEIAKQFDKDSNVQVFLTNPDSPVTVEA